MVYTQWTVIILNLPISWLPEQLSFGAAATTVTATAPASNGVVRAQEHLTWLVGAAVGGLASLDCLFTSWNIKLDLSTVITLKALIK